MPEGINQLRIGTAFLNGFVNNGLPRIPNTFQDTFILKTEIIEVKDKPSAPYELSADFFDNIDLRKRAIVAVGKQDTDVRFMYPIDERLEMGTYYSTAYKRSGPFSAELAIADGRG